MGRFIGKCLASPPTFLLKIKRTINDASEEQRLEKAHLAEPKPHQINHLLFRRTFIFADEWLSYFLMLYLYDHHPELLWIVVPLDLWDLRKQYGIVSQKFNIRKFIAHFLQNKEE